MNQNQDRYGRSLTRLLHELRWAIAERAAYNELCRIAPRTSWGFFSYASVALKNDLYSHVIKVLDRHKGTSSFWYIYNCKQEIIRTEIKRVGLDIEEIKILAEKLKKVRDKTHFHIDKKKVFSPKNVWKDANIKGKEFNKVIDGLWVVLNSLHVNHFNESFLQPIYDAKDIEPLLHVARKNGIKI